MERKKNQILSREILRGQRIPMLHKDEDWIELFGNSKDKEIIKYRDKLVELEQKEKSTERLLRQLSKEKKKYMKMILKASDTINNENKKSNIKFLDEYKEKLLTINEKIDEVSYQLEIIPDEKREANLNLLNITISRGYDELDRREEELNKVTEELEEINKKMAELVEIKSGNEEWINNTYTFMHRLLGNDLIERIDKVLSR